MDWKFYPKKEYEKLEISGEVKWENHVADAKFEIKGGDENQPLRIYGLEGDATYYLGLMMPQEGKMILNFKRECPEFSELMVTIGRIEEDYICVATGKLLAFTDTENVEKQKGEENSVLLEFPWKQMFDSERETEEQQFLFAHPSTQANLKFYGHYCKYQTENEMFYAFASSFGPHPLPHLAKYACWYDVDLQFGFRGYFIIGLRKDGFFLPEFTEESANKID